MSTWRSVVMPLVACCALIASVACGGDNGGEAPAGDRSPARIITRSPAAAGTPAPPSETPQTAATSTPPEDGTEGDLAALRRIRNEFEASRFSATYEARGGDAQAYVINKDGARFRMDITGSGESPAMNATILINETASYLCFTGEQAEVFGGDASGVCVEDPGGQGNALDGLLSAFTVDEGVRLLDTSQRSIAGRAATCYETEDTESGAAGTVCVSAGGALLAVESADAGGVNVVATSISDDVDEAQFEPPYEVRALPAGD
jgi:hypothetical protein